MIQYFLEVAPQLWPHAVFVLLVAASAHKAKTVLTAVLGISILAILLASLYWLLQNGIAPPRSQTLGGQFLALILAGSVPLTGAAIAARVARGRGLSRVAEVSVATTFGILLLVFVPSIQLVLGCALTGVCL